MKSFVLITKLEPFQHQKTIKLYYVEEFQQRYYLVIVKY